MNLEYFLTRLPEGTPEPVAEAMLVKFHAAEQRAGRALGESYAYSMVRHYYADLERNAGIAVRKAQRDVVAKAKAIQAEAKAERLARLREQALTEFVTLCATPEVGKLSVSEHENLTMLRMFVFNDETTARVREFFSHRRLDDNAIQARVSRLRRKLRPVAERLGLAALIEFAFDARSVVHVLPGKEGQ